MKLVEFYSSLLGDTSVFDETGEGFLSMRLDDKYNPLYVEGKRLVLPTKEILRGGNWDQRIVYHPMGEKLTRGESPVLKAFKDYIQLHVTVVISSIAQQLMHVAANRELQKNLGKAAPFLKKLPTADAKTEKALDDVIRKITKDPTRRLITFYLKRGGKTNEEVRRSCIVSFPIYDELENDSQEIFGVKMPRKSTDKQFIREVFDYILGDKETRELYSVGSNNLDAPYFHSLISSFYKLATRLNEVIDRHAKHLENADEMRFKLDWAEHRDNLALFSGLIPDQDGNEGVVIDDGREDAKPDIQQRAAEVFNRPSSQPREEVKEDLPWDEPRRPESREPRREEAPVAKGKIGIHDFLNTIDGRRREQRPVWGRERTDDRNNFARGFERQEDDRFQTRRSGYDGASRERLRSPSPRSRGRTL